MGGAKDARGGATGSKWAERTKNEPSRIVKKKSLNSRRLLIVVFAAGFVCEKDCW